MIDVNIIATGNTARLIELECQRFGLSYTISDTPVKGAKIYVCASSAGDKKTPPQKTVTVSDTFLLEEFRKDMTDVISKLSAQSQAGERKAKSTSVTLNAETGCAKLRGTEIPLSPTEAKILGLLLAKKGETVSHGEINSLINGKDTNKVNVYVCHLRKKLEARGDKVIYSIRGKGFILK